MYTQAHTYLYICVYVCVCVCVCENIYFSNVFAYENQCVFMCVSMNVYLYGVTEYVLILVHVYFLHMHWCSANIY